MDCIINTLKTIIITLLIIFLLSACGDKAESNSQNKVKSIISQKQGELVTDTRKPMSSGHNQTIYIFADDEIWAGCEEFLKNSLERPFFTLENEKLFELSRADIKNVRQMNRFKNLLFLCNINSDAPVSRYIREILPETAVNTARETSGSMFMNHNLWANDQLVTFFLADNLTGLRKLLYENNNKIFGLYYDKFITRINFQSKRLKGYPDSTFEQMPFIIYIPETYRVFASDLDNNFISFLWRSRENQTENPDKYISIYWETVEEGSTQPSDLNQWLIDKRRELAWKYYDEDEFNLNETIRGRMDFEGREAHFLRGKWQNQKYIMGGSFQAFAFYDEAKKTIYLIDTSVYFPAGYKLRYMLELEGIAKTITPK